MRFGELRRAIPRNISARMLSERLRSLEAMGFVHRPDTSTMPPNVSYRLSESGAVIHVMPGDLERLANDASLISALRRQAP